MEDNWLMFINRKYLTINVRALRHAYKPISCKSRSQKVHDKRLRKSIARAQREPRRWHGTFSTIKFSATNNPEDWSVSENAGSIDIT